MNNKVTFSTILNAVIRLIALNAAVLLVMTLCRVAFFVHFGSSMDFSGLENYIVQAFVLGARFDLVQAWVNVLVLLTLFISWAIGSRKVFEGWLSGLTWYYTFFFSVIFTIIGIDFGFYSFFNEHINILIFGFLEDDTKALVSTMWNNYPIIRMALGYLVMIAVVYTAVRVTVSAIRKAPETVRVFRVPVKVSSVLVLLFVNFFAVRGSFGMFPLDIMDSAISPNVFINKLPLNGVYTFYRAVEFRLKDDKSYNLLRSLGYEGRIEDAVSAYTGKPVKAGLANPISALIKRTPANPVAAKLRPNVVVFLMESFASHLVGYNSADFDMLGSLKSHFEQDHVFWRFVSSDIGTIGSLESFLMNTPKRPESKYITQSKYAFNSYASGMAVPYQNAGYETIFIYGGNVGWRNINAFVPLQGFSQCLGDGSMNPKYGRNEWGVYDEHLFDFTLEKLAENPDKPKFIFVVTTSNHPPYTLPAAYQPRPTNMPPAARKLIASDTDLVDKRVIAYQYANQKFAYFLTVLKGGPLGAKTVVAASGDHSFHLFDYGSERPFDVLGVPFYLYIPEALKPAKLDADTPGSHADIIPTLYGLTLSNQPYLAIGQDMFSRGDHTAYNTTGLIFSNKAVARYDYKTGAAEYLTWDPANNRRLVSAPKNAEHERIIEYYKSALALTDYLVHNPMKPSELK
jgi:phosphoglycerol transferase MdoB-like AlkP superfamily enzyme